jgi:hypothetical protein
MLQGFITQATSPAFINRVAQQVTAQIGGQMMAGFALQLASGVLGSFFRPLAAGPFAQPVLPSMWQVACGCAPALPTIVPPGWQLPEPAAQWTATTGPNGRGSIDLGDGYRLELNEHNSEIKVFNSNTGEETRIWGDPHVEQNGRHAFDFWGTTTFTLENGTKITINTEMWNGNPNAYVASQLVITNGNNAITVDGISQNQIGDLSITMGQNGRALDAAHRDGYTLHENAGRQTGIDLWRTETGEVATQQHLNATRVGAEYGPGSNRLSLAESGALLGQFLTAGLLLGMLGQFAGAGSASDSTPSRTLPANPAAALLALALLA